MNHSVVHHSHKKEYLVIFVILAVLTLFEIFIADSNISQGLRASGLVGLALGKAFIVAYWYMHLKEETRWLKFVAAVPLAAFGYATVLLLEMWAR